MRAELRGWELPGGRRCRAKRRGRAAPRGAGGDRLDVEVLATVGDYRRSGFVPTPRASNAVASPPARLRASLWAESALRIRSVSSAGDRAQPNATSLFT